MNALLLINEKSGTVLECGADAIIETAQTAAMENNIKIETFIGDFESLRKKIRTSQNHDAILCAGGDGTQAAIASALMNSDRALLPLPCGTMNLLCRDLGLSLDIKTAITTGLSAPIRAIDAARIGERVFLNNIVFGAYAALADAREDLREIKNFDDVSFGIAEAAHALINADPMDFSVIADDEKINQTTNTIVVSNNAISGAEQLIPYRDCLDEGALYVYLSNAGNGLEFAALLSDFVRGDIDASERISVKKCTKCRISAGGNNFNYTVDGDPVEAVDPVNIIIEPGALKVFAPALA